MIVSKVYTENARGERLLTGMNLEVQSASGRHHFYPQQIDDYERLGILSITDTHIEVEVANGTVRWKIDHPPGLYCLFDGEKLPDDSMQLPQGHPDRGKEGREYVEKHFAGQESPDPSCPGGYKWKPYYGATVEA